MKHSVYISGTGFGKSAIILWLLTSALATVLRGQTVDFVFVAPSANLTATFGGSALSSDFFAPGYGGVVVTASNVVRFRAIAPPKILHIYTQLQPGSALRRAIDPVRQISEGNVDLEYLLIDDRSGLGANTGVFSPFNHGGKVHAWPTASSRLKPDGSNRYIGRVRLGEVAGDVISTLPGGILAWEGTALHETLHTQWVGPWTRWGAINQRAITYGADGDHYNEELLGDPEAAINEGMGTFYGHLHNPAERIEKINFFKRDDFRYFVEGQSVLAGDPDLNIPVRRRGSRSGVLVWEYRWRDVPGFELTFSESTSTIFFVFFWQHVNNNPDQALRMINSCARSMWRSRMTRFLTYACNRLALDMEAFAATPDGTAARSAGSLTSSMFPFALLDIVTHFGMDERTFKADYDRNHPDRQPRAYTEYWRHRDIVRNRVQADLAASPIRIEAAVTAAHRYFQQTNTILAATSP